MTTDLRAALRDDRATLAWLLIDQQEHQHDEIDADDSHREKRQRAVDVLTKIVAFADAPPTVAELLPLVDATHEVRWVAATTGEQMRYCHENGCEYLRSTSRGGGWGSAHLNRHDLTQPATLVEVTP